MVLIRRAKNLVFLTTIQCSATPNPKHNLLCAKLNRWLQSSILLLLLTGCAFLPPPTPVTLPTPSPIPLDFTAEPPAQAIPRLIETERQASIDRDLRTLIQLWAPDSRIIDGRGTIDLTDDYVWPGQAAVLDRYVVAVFPNPPPPLTLPADLAIQVTGAQATLQNGQDHWSFVYQAGRWWIAELRYNQ